MTITINTCPPVIWDHYVENHPHGTVYHLYSWREVFGALFGYSSYYLAYWEKGQIEGILPLVWMRSWIFGDKLFSLPVVDYGGILYSHERARNALLEKAWELGKKLGVRYIEFHPEIGEAYPGSQQKQGKVTFYLNIQKSEYELIKSLKSSHRAIIRKGEKLGLRHAWMGREGLRDFYSLFSLTMHHHGTPVYPQYLFSKILSLFPLYTKILLIKEGETPIATAFLFFYKGKGEAPWIASPPIGTFRPTDYMYWEIIRYAREVRGCHTFDFGRCTQGGGTYKFKKKWPSQEVPLIWNCLLIKDQELPTFGGENPRHQRIIEIWKKLPFPLVQWMGPILSRYIP